MKEKYVVTISHRLGSGGAQVGQMLSDRLGIPFIDSQVLKRVSDQLGMSEAAVEDRQEKKLSFWDLFLRGEALSMPLPGENLAPMIPTDEMIHTLETRYIEQIAARRSCIILGRGGNHILRRHPRRLSVFVFADEAARVKRIRSLYGVDTPEAIKIMERNDREREAYIKKFTGDDMLDMHLYDLCLDTSTLGYEHTAELIEGALRAKLGEI